MMDMGKIDIAKIEAARRGLLERRRLGRQPNLAATSLRWVTNQRIEQLQ